MWVSSAVKVDSGVTLPAKCLDDPSLGISPRAPGVHRPGVTQLSPSPGERPGFIPWVSVCSLGPSYTVRATSGRRGGQAALSEPATSAGHSAHLSHRLPSGPGDLARPSSSLDHELWSQMQLPSVLCVSAEGRAGTWWALWDVHSLNKAEWPGGLVKASVRARPPSAPENGFQGAPMAVCWWV